MPLVGEQGYGREETEGFRGIQGARHRTLALVGEPPSRLCVLEGDAVRDSLQWNYGIEDQSARIRDPIVHLCITGNIRVHLYPPLPTQGC